MVGAVRTTASVSQCGIVFGRLCL